tara:strand:+ start:785 stop:1306 length:522 start_codon:yes stop_codon:yes gene_type:complete
MENIQSKLRAIKVIMLDVDGVLTDGMVTTLPDGDQVRAMNIKDGYALQHAVKKGYHISIISGGTSESVRLRLNGLGIEDIHLGCKNKLVVFENLLKKHQITPAEILYMGDDLPDYTIMQKVGYAACPKDAATEIKSIATYVSSYKGGKGCVRDVLERLMRLQNNWFDGENAEW